ncbi:hypothetical protein [Mycobacterium lepromatosis]|uniref:hypothetical protein n=1 Tax=Mycobacterium lepromatosis TaxID=480418 RepID=UPI0005F781AE|nr:hypothetical protein [Mycobacterium lepromatosis]
MLVVYAVGRHHHKAVYLTDVLRVAVNAPDRSKDHRIEQYPLRLGRRFDNFLYSIYLHIKLFGDGRLRLDAEVLADLWQGSVFKVASEKSFACSPSSIEFQLPNHESHFLQILALAGLR